MSKLLCASLAAAGFVCVSFGAAQAGDRQDGCCGPLPPRFVYRDVEQVRHVTRYRDVVQPYYVYRHQEIVHVTRVHPVVYVDYVTRVHEQPIERVVPEYVSQTEYAPETEYSSRRTYYIKPPCDCSDCR